MYRARVLYKRMWFRQSVQKLFLNSELFMQFAISLFFSVFWCLEGEKSYGKGWKQFWSFVTLYKSVMFLDVLSYFHNFLYNKVAVLRNFIDGKTAVFWHGKICLYKLLSLKRLLEGKKLIK